ncbi:MAG: hypothetical protein OXG44_17005, partial [Gammaproteobacteria bacterium]|nr:hypothetical protein [Gammaproteobacteria bacterium]
MTEHTLTIDAASLASAAGLSGERWAIVGYPSASSDAKAVYAGSVALSGRLDSQGMDEAQVAASLVDADGNAITWLVFSLPDLELQWPFIMPNEDAVLGELAGEFGTPPGSVGPTPGPPGRGIATVSVTADDELVGTYTDGSSWDAGRITVDAGQVNIVTDDTIDGHGTALSPLGVSVPITAVQLNKLDGIAAGAEVNVQADWDEDDEDDDSFIQNKPTIPPATPSDRLLPTLPAAGSRDDKIPKFDGDTLKWEPDAGGGGGAALSDNKPQPLGTPAPGSGTEASRDDHVHSPPTWAQVSGKPDRIGAFTAADETKLDGIEAGAQVNPDAQEIADAIDGDRQGDIDFSRVGQGAQADLRGLIRNGVVSPAALTDAVKDLLLIAFPDAGSRNLKFLGFDDD